MFSQTIQTRQAKKLVKLTCIKINLFGAIAADDDVRDFYDVAAAVGVGVMAWDENSFFGGWDRWTGPPISGVQSYPQPILCTLPQ